MTPTCGTRSAAAHSASVMGLLSASAEAAARRCFVVFASARLQSILGARLAVFFMVASSFLWLGKARRDDAHPLAAHGVADCEQALLNHAEQDESVLAVVSPPIFADHRECVAEGAAGSLEAHAMSGEIPGVLVVIPFEIVIPHILRLSRTWQGCRDEIREQYPAIRG